MIHLSVGINAHLSAEDLESMDANEPTTYGKPDHELRRAEEGQPGEGRPEQGQQVEGQPTELPAMGRLQATINSACEHMATTAAEIQTLKLENARLFTSNQILQEFRTEWARILQTSGNVVEVQPARGRWPGQRSGRSILRGHVPRGFGKGRRCAKASGRCGKSAPGFGWEGYRVSRAPKGPRVTGRYGRRSGNDRALMALIDLLRELLEMWRERSAAVPKQGPRPMAPPPSPDLERRAKEFIQEMLTFKEWLARQGTIANWTHASASAPKGSLMPW